MVIGGVVCGETARGRGDGAEEEHVTTVRGRVLNAVTKESVTRALVILEGENSATFSDDRGQFELKISEKNAAANGAIGAAVVRRPVEARKPGFLEGRHMATSVYAPGLTTKEQAEVTVFLVPEALIVGHVEVPGSEGDVRIQCQLFRRGMNEGRETWWPQATFTTWADGEFRFSELKAGTYKLITLEQVDPDSTMTPGAQLYAYPPLYYPNTTDFSVATPIVVKAGETARVNLTVARREYHPVKITVANMPMGRGLNLLVYPIGHRSPGWSLGYDATEGMIQGSLPDGNYTVEASTQDDGEMNGILNFSVKGAPVEGPTLNLVPDATVSVMVREEFQSGQSNFRTAQTVSGNPQLDARRISNVHVDLIPIDVFNPFRRNASSQMAEGSEGPELTIPNVGPGRYAVHVSSGIGYAASVQSGGKDLMRQPLVLALGGAVAPIEVLLRDDGAEVDGTLEEGTTAGGDAGEQGVAYLVPAGEGGQPRSVSAWQGKFTMQQVPPGNYVVAAFEDLQQELPYGNEEATQWLVSKGGQMIHLEVGQKVNVKVRVFASEGE